MPTIYVENVPDDLYEALRSRAEAKQTSIGAEVLAVLAEHLRTPYEQMRRLRAQRPATATSFPTAEEMLREDRSR